MSGSFTIDVDPTRDFVHITMSGLFQPEDIAAFVHARTAAHAKLRCLPGCHLTLNDLRGVKIQSQEIVEAFRELLADPGRFQSRQLAFVCPPTLARMQLERAMFGRDARCFETVEEAQDWLFGKEAPAQVQDCAA